MSWREQKELKVRRGRRGGGGDIEIIGKKKGEEEKGTDERIQLIDKHVIPLVVYGFGHKDQVRKRERNSIYEILFRIFETR